MDSNEDEETIFILANELYNCCNAYLVLKNIELFPQDSVMQPPLLVFTDASVRQDCRYAAFGIVTENISTDFSLPTKTIEKYDIQIEDGSYSTVCILSGVVNNHDIDATEIMAILAAVEIFQYLVDESDQKIVIYTDSLSAKKILTDDRLPSGTDIYSNFREYYKKIVHRNNNEIIIKKVKAHAGHEMNEIADSVAIQRCILANN
jgi:ribonuclease HI